MRKRCQHDTHDFPGPNYREIADATVEMLRISFRLRILGEPRGGWPLGYFNQPFLIMPGTLGGTATSPWAC